MRWSLYILIFISFNSCDYLQPKENPEAIARVGNSFLYYSEIEDLGLDTSSSDSLEIVEAYINTWIRKESYLQHAKEQLSADQQKQLEQKVIDYQESLFTNEYENLMVQSRLDTTFTEEEILAYYENNQEEFTIQKPIVQFIALKSDQKFQNIKEIDTFIEEYVEDGNDVNLKEFCLYNTVSCQLDIQSWSLMEKFHETIQSNIEYSKLKVNRLESIESGDYHYLYKIISKKSDGVYPLSFVTDEIKSILLRVREREFVEALRNEIFEQTKEKNYIEIY